MPALLNAQSAAKIIFFYELSKSHQFFLILHFSFSFHFLLEIDFDGWNTGKFVEYYDGDEVGLWVETQHLIATAKKSFIGDAITQYPRDTGVFRKQKQVCQVSILSKELHPLLAQTQLHPVSRLKPVAYLDASGALHHQIDHLCSAIFMLIYHPLNNRKFKLSLLFHIWVRDASNLATMLMEVNYK